MSNFLNHKSEFFSLIDRSVFIANSIVTSADDWFDSVAKFLIEKSSTSKTYFIGNGASAGMASHFASDFTKNGWVPSLTLHDSSLLTCFSNDYSYADAFERMLHRFFDPDDTLIAISSSGSSKNVLNAVSWVKSSYSAGSIVSFSGFHQDNELRKLSGHSCYVPSSHYGFVESAHAYLLHVLIDRICTIRSPSEASSR